MVLSLIKSVQIKFLISVSNLFYFCHLGSGTTNDGNTARKFFQEPSKSAQITGVDENLITRFSCILTTISRGHKINHQKFEDYAKETARLFVHLYPWFYLPASVHKVLIHGGHIIRAALLPIGG